MRTLTLFLAAFAIAALPEAGFGQISIEAHGDVGYNFVDARAWLGNGAFDANPLVTGGDIQVVFGRREGRGLQVGLETGFQTLMNYSRVVNGQPREFAAEAIRLAVATRFWLGEGAWFGEASFGTYFFAGENEPTLMAGAGTLFNIAERWSVPVRVRAAILFSPLTTVAPVWLSTGLSYRLKM